jgi:hypothetical protein
MFADISFGSNKDFLSSGLCDYFYRSLELAQGDYSATSLITQQLMDPSALKDSVKARLELAIQTVVLNIQRQLSVLDLYQSLELPYTSPGYSPEVVSNDVTSPNPPRSANTTSFSALGSRNWQFQGPATIAGNLSQFNWFNTWNPSVVSFFADVDSSSDQQVYAAGHFFDDSLSKTYLESNIDPVPIRIQTTSNATFLGNFLYARNGVSCATCVNGSSRAYNTANSDLLGRPDGPGPYITLQRSQHPWYAETYIFFGKDLQADGTLVETRICCVCI